MNNSIKQKNGVKKLKYKNITWISFLVTLSTLTIPTKTIATDNNSVSSLESSNIENRLTKIAKTLKERESQLMESADSAEIVNPLEEMETAGWVNGRRGGFANRPSGGGFLNRRGWRDGGGFLNRRPWRNGGGFVNRRGGRRGFVNRR